MPCVIVTGHPASGKTTAALLLRDRALKHPAIDQVILINEESECGCGYSSADKYERNSTNISKQSCYENASAEKSTRGTLKAAFDRAVGAVVTPQQRKRRLIILDSLNYIKGYRYELHCISKAAGETHGVLWILNDPSVVATRNEKMHDEKGGQQGYSSALLQELILRYEPPDDRNRWDRPLFTIDMSRRTENAPHQGNQQQAAVDTSSSTGKDISSKSEVLKQTVYNMHNLGDAFGASQALSDSPHRSDAHDAMLMTKLQAARIPSKSAFKRVPKKSVCKKVMTKPEEIQQQHAYTPDDLVVISSLKENEAQLIPNVSNASNDVSGPTCKHESLEEEIDRILDTFLLQTQALKEGTSTRHNVAGQANALQNLDFISAQLISAIAKKSATASTGFSVLRLNVPNLNTDGNCNNRTITMKCTRPVTLPELRRLRTMYLQWAVNYPPADTTEYGIASSFVAYAEEHLNNECP